MAKNQTLELSILIGGHVDNSLTQAVKSANTQLSSMANGASKLAANIAKVTVGIASGITAGLVDATKEAVAFESEMLDVTKYVSGLTDANGKVKTDAYAEMSKDILDLSTQIPYTAKELTRLAAAAGQSGKSMDDLISGGFLKDVAEMGTAMDISADQAGDWAAKWEVAFNMNHDQVMELADQIKPGDIIVAGKNFGCGSSREQAPEIIKALGIQCVIAKSFARIFFRNSINNGLLLIEQPTLYDDIKEGDTISVVMNEHVDYNGKTYPIAALPENLMDIIRAGGLVKAMRKLNGLD